jgi:hypothetical protein
MGDRVAVLVVAAMVCHGCSGSGPASGAPDGGAEPLGPPLYVESGQCPRRVHALRHDQRTPTGFSFDELITHIRAVHRGPLSWTGPAADFDISPPAAEIMVTIELVPDLDGIRWHDAEGLTLMPSPTAGIPPPCPTEMQVDATVHLSSDDGTFAEVWPLTFHVREATGANFQIRIGGVSQSGNWHIAYRTPAMNDSVRVDGVYVERALYLTFFYSGTPVTCPDPNICYFDYLCANFTDYQP